MQILTHSPASCTPLWYHQKESAYGPYADFLDHSQTARLKHHFILLVWLTPVEGFLDCYNFFKLRTYFSHFSLIKLWFYKNHLSLPISSQHTYTIRYTFSKNCRIYCYLDFIILRLYPSMSPITMLNNWYRAWVEYNWAFFQYARYCFIDVTTTLTEDVFWFQTRLFLALWMANTL